MASQKKTVFGRNLHSKIILKGVKGIFRGELLIKK